MIDKYLHRIWSTLLHPATDYYYYASSITQAANKLDTNSTRTHTEAPLLLNCYTHKLNLPIARKNTDSKFVHGKHNLKYKR